MKQTIIKTFIILCIVFLSFTYVSAQNPYAGILWSSLENRIENLVATKIASKKNSMTMTQYNNYINWVVAKLEVLKNKYDNPSILNIIWYLIYELESTLINDDDFFSDLSDAFSQDDSSTSSSNSIPCSPWSVGCWDDIPPQPTTSSSSTSSSSTSSTSTSSSSSSSTSGWSTVPFTWNYTSSISRDGYSFNLSWLDRVWTDTYEFSHFVSYDMINVSVPSWININSCIIKPSTGWTIYLREVLKNNTTAYAKRLPEWAKTLDLLCWFAWYSSSSNPHVEIRRLCTESEIENNNFVKNTDSVYSSSKCSMIHKRIFLTHNPNAKSYNEYYLESIWADIPEISLDVSNSNPRFMDKVRLSWTIDGDIDYCSIDNWWALWQTYNRSWLTNETHIYPNQTWWLDFYATSSGTHELTCYKTYKRENSINGIKLTKKNKISITVSWSKEDLVTISAENAWWTQYKISWEIDSRLDPTTCVSGGFDFNNRASWTVYKIDSSYNPSFNLQCLDPSNRSTISSQRYFRYYSERLESDRDPEVSFGSYKKSWNQYELKWTVKWREYCYIKDANKTNSIYGKNQIYLGWNMWEWSLLVSLSNSNGYILTCVNPGTSSIWTPIALNGDTSVPFPSWTTWPYSDSESYNTKSNLYYWENIPTNTSFQQDGKPKSYSTNNAYNYSESSIRNGNINLCEIWDVVDMNIQSYTSYKKVYFRCSWLNGWSKSREVYIKINTKIAACWTISWVKMARDYNNNYKNMSYTALGTIQSSIENKIKDSVCGYRSNMWSYTSQLIWTSSKYMLSKWTCSDEYSNIVYCGLKVTWIDSILASSSSSSDSTSSSSFTSDTTSSSSSTQTTDIDETTTITYRKTKSHELNDILKNKGCYDDSVYQSFANYINNSYNLDTAAANPEAIFSAHKTAYDNVMATCD